jgi:hypothetical protein
MNVAESVSTVVITTIALIKEESFESNSNTEALAAASFFALNTLP